MISFERERKKNGVKKCTPFYPRKFCAATQELRNIFKSKTRFDLFHNVDIL